MESAAFFHGGHCRAGTTTTHFAPEKKADHFIVEDLLDFSNDEEEEDAGIDAVEGNSSTESSTVTAVNSFNSSSAGDNVASRSLADDLCEPYEELAELEWLSNFVEDSFSSEDFQKLHHFTGIKSTSYSAPDSESRGSLLTPSKPATTLRQEPPVPGKARSKRSRAAPSSWSSELLVLLPSPATFSESELLVEAMAGKKTAKLEKKRDPVACRALAAAPDGRKCLHCATDKTPQWRTGPMGPKTLCNACGVRYKSGRLVPEYRPAASPTFVLSKHSNSHRKVLELRRQKELQQPQPHHFHAGAAIFDGVPSESGDIFLIRQQIGADFCD